MLLRNFIKFTKSISKGQTKISVGDLISKQTVFKDESTSILDKMFNIVRQQAPPKTPPHIQTGSAFSDLIGNTLPQSIYVKQDFWFKKTINYGEKVNIRMQVIGIKEKKIELKTQILNNAGDILVDGKSLIIYNKLENL